MKKTTEPISKDLKTQMKASLQEHLKDVDPKDTLDTILAAIRKHDPEDQNSIIEQILREIAIDRNNRYRVTQDEHKKAAMHLDRYISLSRSAEVAIKESENLKANY